MYIYDLYGLRNMKNIKPIFYFSEFHIRSIKMANKMPRKGSAENSNIPHTRIDEESWINKYYEVGEKIGQGMFGKVFKVTHKETDEYWAMKVVNKEKVNIPCHQKRSFIFFMEHFKHSAFIE